MPMSVAFRSRLFPLLPSIIENFGTPFHIYDEVGIRQTAGLLKDAFANFDGFQEFFAVKANPNPAILHLMDQAGFGFDCSSIPELLLARKIGALGKQIMFTSNNTGPTEFKEAKGHGGCIINLDDPTMIAKVSKPFPELICFRYNPGDRQTGNDIIGDPVNSKYGVPHENIVEAYRLARKRGAKEFGLHTMICSNQLTYGYFGQTVRMLLDVAAMLNSELGIKLEFINIGGGFGIPYKPDDQPIPLKEMASSMKKLFEDSYYKIGGYKPRLFMENGRFITGPHGVLVTRVINRMRKYKEFVGVDACCTSTMMRPAMYYNAKHDPWGGYHDISVFKGEDRPLEKVNVVGSACENNDQFGRDRLLPKVTEGDVILVHDTGAHCYAMANNYNGRLRPAELMLLESGEVIMVRRAETIEDYFATLRILAD